MKIQKRIIIADLRKVYKRIGKPPSKTDYLKYGNYGVNTVKQRFNGSWNDAIIRSVGKTRTARRKRVEGHLCKNCGKLVVRQPSQIMKNIFCSQSCAASYNNVRKNYGVRISKLERWIQSELLLKYPKIKFVFNGKQAINSELDIYIPSLKLAFELNGVFHYEPIFGKEKLIKIQNNDNRKFQACLEKGIELCIIDASQLRYFKLQKAKPYFEIISKIIEKKLGPVGYDPTT